MTDLDNPLRPRSAASSAHAVRTTEDDWSEPFDPVQWEDDQPARFDLSRKRDVSLVMVCGFALCAIALVALNRDISTALMIVLLALTWLYFGVIVDDEEDDNGGAAADRG